MPVLPVTWMGMNEFGGRNWPHPARVRAKGRLGQRASPMCIPEISAQTNDFCPPRGKNLLTSHEYRRMLFLYRGLLGPGIRDQFVPTQRRYRDK